MYLIVLIVLIMEWKEIDKESLAEAAYDLKEDEFIYSASFDTSSANKALDISSPKLDYFLQSDKLFNLKDILANHEIIDEKADIETIRQICGHFFDNEMDWLCGFSPLFNILSSIYIHKEYEIKNPILRYMFMCFSYTVTLISQHLNEQQMKIKWWNYCNITDYINTHSIEDIENEKKNLDLPPDLDSLSNFQLDLVKVILNPTKSHMRENYDICTKSSPIGFFKTIMYHDKSLTSTPIKHELKSHQEYIQMMNDLINDIKYIQTSFVPKSLFDSISYIFNWNQMSDHISITRLFALEFLVGNSGDNMFFGNKSDIKYLEEEIKPLGIFQAIKRHPKFNNLVDTFGLSVYSIFRALILPIPEMNKELGEKVILIWSQFQNEGYQQFTESLKAKDFPNCANSEHQSCLRFSFPLWTISIATSLATKYYQSGFMCGIFSPRDYHIVWSMFDFAYANMFSALDQLRIVRAAVNISQHRNKKAGAIKGNEIESKKGEQSLDNKLSQILATAYSGITYLWAYLLNSGAISAVPPFENQYEIYNARVNPCRAIAHISIKEFDDFLIEISRQDLLELSRLALNEAKRLLSALKIPTQSGFDTESKALLRSIISASLVAAGFKPGQHVIVSFEYHNIYPIFSLK